MKKLLRICLIIVIILILAGLGWFGYRKIFRKTPPVQFNTEKLERMDLASTISATGTVEPEELVNVGAQVSGKIIEFGRDLQKNEVDYRSPVKEGMLLARIDDVVYNAEMRSANAQKLKAEAAILSAKANIAFSKAKLALAENNWKRAQALWPKKAMSQSDYDSYKAELEAARATVSINEASLADAKASLSSATAAYDKAKRNLEYCTITSPVDGVIIDRRVSIGQTVVSNMSASSMFLIAKDLKRMQVWVSVNEADIGSLKDGMPVEFTVDAFPNETFVGKVHKIRLNATMSQNVVTYVVEVSTDNSNGRLLPYLTANVKFIQDQRKNVPAVSNAALRFRPDPAMIPQEFQGALKTPVRGGKERTVWIRSGKDIRPVQVTTGLNDGVMTEIVSGDLKEGDEVIVGIAPVLSKKSGSANAGSPFLPKPPQRQKAKPRKTTR